MGKSAENQRNRGRDELKPLFNIGCFTYFLGGEFLQLGNAALPLVP